MPMPKKSLAGLAFAFVLIVAGWLALGAPFSIAELRFNHRVGEAVRNGSNSLDLGTLMPGNWELVCSSNCYDGSGPYVAEYNRRYPVVSACQDRSWGLVFIARDGSYTSAAGDCRS